MEGGEGLLAIDRVLVLESKGPEINTNLTHKLPFIEATRRGIFWLFGMGGWVFFTTESAARNGAGRGDTLAHRPPPHG